MGQAPAQATSDPSAVLAYAPRSRARRAWRWVRPGSAGFFLIVLALGAGGAWGSWKWMLYRDRRAFEACTKQYWGPGTFTFVHAPSRAALRHLARLPGRYQIALDYPAAEAPAAEEAFGNVALPNVTVIFVGEDADALLKQFARPDSGLSALSRLNLVGSHVTDAGLRELARPDSDLKALVTLDLSDTQVTDLGLRELARPDSGLKALCTLDLNATRVTDTGLKELARTDSGLKTLATVYLVDTHVTDAGISELHKAHPGLKIIH